jgi:hypothetical protein
MKTKTTKTTTKTKTKGAPAKGALAHTRRFAVAASYTADCCPTPHVWVALVRATDAKAAAALHEKQVARKKVILHDVIAVPFSPKTKTAPEAGRSEHVAHPGIGLSVAKTARVKGGAK